MRTPCPSRRRLLRALCAAPFAGARALGAQGSSWPARTVRLVVPWAPGGLVDTGARVLAEPLTRTLGQPVVVENVAGAAGAIGSDQVAKAAPDGYTLLMGTSSLAIDAHAQKPLPYDAVRDFTTVALVATAQSVIVVNPASPIRSVRDLMAAARAKPGELTYGTPGIGSPANLFGEQFKQMAAVDILHVPYSKSPAINDLIGGRLSLMFATIPVALPQIRADKLRAIAVTGEHRFPTLPDVPTVSESGLPGYEAGQWLGLLAPAGTPAPIVERLNAEVNRALATDAVVRAFHERGMDTRAGTPDAFRQTLLAEVQKWGAVLRAGGIRLE